MTDSSIKTRGINLTIAAVVLPILFNFSIFFYSICRQIPFGGSQSYGAITYNLLERGKYSMDGVNNTFFRPPLYPILLILPRAINGENWHIYARLLQCLLSIMCGLMVFQIASRVTENRLIGLVSVVLYLLHLALQAEHYAQRETILFELILLCLVYIFLIKKVLDIKTVATASLLSSGLYLTRPSGILFLLVTLLVVFYQSKNDDRIKHLLVSLVVFAAAASPWQFYNYRAFSKVTFSSSNTSGLNLYKGASPVVQSIFPQIDIDYATPYIHNQLKDNGIDAITEEYKANSFLSKEAKKLIIQHPGHFLKKMLKQLLTFYSPVFTPFGRGKVVPDGENLVVQNFKFSFGVVELNYFVMSMVLIPFGLFELLRVRNVSAIERRFKILSLLILLLMTILHMLTFAETRFRLPLDGLLCVAAAIFYVRYLSNHRLTQQ